MPVAGKERCDEAPPMHVRGAAVDEHEPRAAAVPPLQVVDLAPVDVDDVFVAGGSEVGGKPAGGVVHSRQVTHRKRGGS